MGVYKTRPPLIMGVYKTRSPLKMGVYRTTWSTSLQLNNSFLGFEIDYALCNRDKKLVFVLIHLSKLFQMQSEIVALPLNVSPPFLYIFFYYIAELVLVLNMYNIFSAGFNQPTINQSYIWSTLFFTLHNRCNIQEKAWRYRRRNQKP
jgi:hypothetical protein